MNDGMKVTATTVESESTVDPRDRMIPFTADAVTRLHLFLYGIMDVPRLLEWFEQRVPLNTPTPLAGMRLSGVMESLRHIIEREGVSEGVSWSQQEMMIEEAFRAQESWSETFQLWVTERDVIAEERDRERTAQADSARKAGAALAGQELDVTRTESGDFAAIQTSEAVGGFNPPTSMQLAE